MWWWAGWCACASAAALLLLLALRQRQDANAQRDPQVHVVAVPHVPQPDPAPQIVIVRNPLNSRHSRPSTSSDPGNTGSDSSCTGPDPGNTNTSPGNTVTGDSHTHHPSGSDSGRTVDSGYGHLRREFRQSQGHSLSFGSSTSSPIHNTCFPYPELARIRTDSASNSGIETKRFNHPGIPKLPLPEEWIHKRNLNVNNIKYPIVKPLAQLQLGADLNSSSNSVSTQDRAKKLSAIRSPSLEKDDKSPSLEKDDKSPSLEKDDKSPSLEKDDKSPSLEKDDKSPFLLSAKSVDSEVFGFDPESLKKVGGMSEKMLSSKETGDVPDSPTHLRRYRSVSTRLNMCSVSETPENDTEEAKVHECSSAKESTKSSTKFDFSPRLPDMMTSPRFFTPPEMVSPMFFAEPSPKSVYYDTVRSPKFFTDTPREELVPQSPKALGDHLNRNGAEKTSKPNSPRVLGGSKPNSPRVLSGKPSPKVHSCNKENYFTFDHVAIKESSASRVSPRPRKYGGRNSIERERFTPPADKDVRKYRRHNSCDAYKGVEVHSVTRNKDKSDSDKDSDNSEAKIDLDETEKETTDVVDCCVQMDALQIEDEAIRAAQARRHRLKSISLDSDNARIIEQNLGLPVAKQLKDQMNEAFKKDVSTSCESMERHEVPTPPESPAFQFDETTNIQQTSPDLKKKSLRHSDHQSFFDMPRFSPKEFEITVTSDEGTIVEAEQMKRKGKNLRNLTIDLSRRDSDLEKELLEFEKLYTDAEEKKVKTPTLKIKATSLDSSETVNLSLPQQQTLEVPQNSISVPNTPKRQLQRILAQKTKPDLSGKSGYCTQGERRLYMKAQDSGIFLRENHANLMLYQPGPSRMGSRTMSSFDENITDFENPPEINISGVDNRGLEPVHLGSNLLNYKQSLSVSSTNLKTLPEGVPSDDFETNEDDKVSKKLHRRNSNQSILLSTHSLQSSSSLTSSGNSSHNLVRTSISNFNLNSDSRKRLSLDRRDSHNSLTNTEHLTPTTRVICSSNTSVEGSKNCLLQRRGSNNSLTLNICPTTTINTISRHSSNSSLNKEAKSQKKGLLERRSSNTSLTLNINTSNPQLAGNRTLSISNYNLEGSTCNLSCYNSNFSIDNTTVEPKKGILERRSSNTSLTLNIPQEPRDLEIDENLIEPHLKEPHKEKHRKSLSTENLLPKSYKSRTCLKTQDKGFGSHDNLWSTSYTEKDQQLMYVCGDQDNEIIYAVGSQDIENFQQGFVRNITTKPLSPQTTSEDFRLYLANMQHLQNASSVLTRQQLRDLNDVFQNGYSKVQCHSLMEGQHCCSNKVQHIENPQEIVPEIFEPCSEYQKTLLRSLHQEFWDMPTNFQEKPLVSGSHLKNRYKTILPNEHSRFLLNGEAGACEGYINANFIKGHEYSKNSYIATQGPLQNTLYDFWLMVHQNNQIYHDRLPDKASNYHGVQKVVMLTNFIENNRQKCEKYFPLELNEEVTFDSSEYTENRNFFEDTDLLKNSFTIKNVGMLNKTGYTIRKLKIVYRKGVKSNISESGKCDPSESGNTDPSESEKCDPSESGKTDPSESGKTHPSESGKTDPSESGKTDPSESGTTDPSESTNSDKSESSKTDISEITVHHYWFHNWADHKCPKDVNALLNLSLDILRDSVHNFKDNNIEELNTCNCESSQSNYKFIFPPLGAENSKCEVDLTKNNLSIDFSKENSPPVVIHCSAGIGRTGCLIAILNGIKQLANEEKVDVLGIVCNMRLNRGGMVQNSEQYELIHKVLCLFEQVCLKSL